MFPNLRVIRLISPRRECYVKRNLLIQRRQTVIKPTLFDKLARKLERCSIFLARKNMKNWRIVLKPDLVIHRKGIGWLEESRSPVWTRAKFTNTGIVLLGAKIERFSAVSFPLAVYVRSPSFDLRISRWRTAQRGASLFLLCNRRQAVRCSRPNCRCVSIPVKYT